MDDQTLLSQQLLLLRMEILLRQVQFVPQRHFSLSVRLQDATGELTSGIFA